jgi:hypothetical protein
VLDLKRVIIKDIAPNGSVCMHAKTVGTKKMQKLQCKKEEVILAQMQKLQCKKRR